MSEIQNNPNQDNESTISLEEVFWPPKIDLTGFLLIILVSVVTGFFAWIGVLIFAFLTSSNFSVQSGASPMLFAMVAFFCLTLANYLYVWWLATIFPQLYTKAKTVFIQVSIFSIILYIIMALMYPMISSIFPWTQGILGVFAFHVLINVFWLILLTGILNQYRYSLLIFYSDFFALISTSIVVGWVYLHFSTSGSTLFILMTLAALSFLISTIIAFWILAAYYQLYRISGNDPIGNILANIENEEKRIEKEAEQSLLTKKQ